MNYKTFESKFYITHKTCLFRLSLSIESFSLSKLTDFSDGAWTHRFLKKAKELKPEDYANLKNKVICIFLFN